MVIYDEDMKKYVLWVIYMKDGCFLEEEVIRWLLIYLLVFF